MKIEDIDWMISHINIHLNNAIKAGDENYVLYLKQFNESTLQRR